MGGGLTSSRSVIRCFGFETTYGVFFFGLFFGLFWARLFSVHAFLLCMERRKGMERKGMERKGMERKGMERKGMEREWMVLL